MSDTTFGTIGAEGEIDELALLLNKCFGTSGESETMRDWAVDHGPDGPRQLRRDGDLLACLMRLPMGHFFGGRSVSTLGIAGVGVQPELRGQGHAKSLMTRALLEARTQGFALSSLYASTFGLYRHLGYERSGSRYRIEVDPRNLSVRETGASLRPLSEEDEPIVSKLYTEQTKLGSGGLDRSEDLWRRARKPASKQSHGMMILEDGQPTGYGRWVQLNSKHGKGYDLVLCDHAVATPCAARRLLAFFTDHGMMAQRVVWYGGPGDPLLALLETTSFTMSISDDWLIRFLDVRAALEGRGYPRGLEAELHLELEDTLFEENAGRHVLRVADGSGSLQPGGDGRLSCSVRGLGPLYTGHMSAAQLRLTGWLESDDASCATAASIFGGPASWMRDFF